MFDKLKQLNELRKMGDAMKKEKITTEKQGVKVTINGNLEVEEVVLNPALSLQEQQSVLKDVLNEAKGEIQKKLAKNLMNFGI